VTYVEGWLLRAFRTPHPRSIFPVKVAGTESIRILKDFIKVKEKPTFDDLPVETISLWKVRARH
jgi:hypothetical protein